MGFLRALFGRSEPVQPNLDVLFALPGAAYTLEASLGFAPTGVGAVAYKPAEGAAAQHSQDEILDLLHLDPGLNVSVTADEFGYTWITARQSVVDLPTLVTALHAINATLADAGFGPSLLCTVVAFTAAADADTESSSGPRRLGLVYLFKRGTVYPFAPVGNRRRDTALELQTRAVLAGDLPIERDLQRWFPVWNGPAP